MDFTLKVVGGVDLMALPIVKDAIRHATKVRRRLYLCGEVWGRYGFQNGERGEFCGAAHCKGRHPPRHQGEAPGALGLSFVCVWGGVGEM